MGSEKVVFLVIFIHPFENSGGYFFWGRLFWWILDINLQYFVRGYFSKFSLRALNIEGQWTLNKCEQSLKDFFSPNVFPGRRMGSVVPACLLKPHSWPHQGGAVTYVYYHYTFHIFLPHQVGACILSNPSKNATINATIRRHPSRIHFGWKKTGLQIAEVCLLVSTI